MNVSVVPATPAHSRLPRPPLGDYIELLWFAETGAQPHAHERILPTGSVDLVCTLDQHGCARSHVCGAHSAYLQVETSAPFRAIGVRFKPGGAFPFFRLPLGELHNLAVPAMVMIESEWPASLSRAPQLDGSSPVVIFVYVPDVDQAVERAVVAGAQILMPLANQFWGDRTAWIMDPAGHVWTVATRFEETTEPERQARLNALHAKAKASG